MAQFNDAKALGEYLLNVQVIFEPYASVMWMMGIRSMEMIANSTKRDMANVLAYPNPPGPMHQIHASHLIALSKPSGMLLRLHGDLGGERCGMG